MGWVALNIISKFTFIIWMQRMKMVHQRKLEAARELYGLSPTDEIAEDELRTKAVIPKNGFAAGAYGLGVGEEAESEEKMVEVVSETMVTLGMSAHTDRAWDETGWRWAPRPLEAAGGERRHEHGGARAAQRRAMHGVEPALRASNVRLLARNGLQTVVFNELFNDFRMFSLDLKGRGMLSGRFGCAQVLIEACQKRWTSEKMNLGQDKGGVVEKEDPFMKLLEANKERVNASGSARRFELISDGFRMVLAWFYHGFSLFSAVLLPKGFQTDL